MADSKKGFIPLQQGLVLCKKDSSFTKKQREYMSKIYRGRSQRLLRLRQEKYIDKVLKRFNMVDSKKGYLPLQQGVVLSKKDSPST